MIAELTTQKQLLSPDQYAVVKTDTLKKIRTLSDECGYVSGLINDSFQNSKHTFQSRFKAQMKLIFPLITAIRNDLDIVHTLLSYEHIYQELIESKQGEDQYFMKS